MEKKYIDYLIEGNNYPPTGYVSFDTSDHIRFQNGQDVSGHNFGCNRRFVIEKNIEGGEGYTVTMYNLDGLHPLWKDNIQMAPKRMRIISTSENVVELRGYGYDENALAFGLSSMTGLRLGDMQHIRWGDIKLIDGIQTICIIQRKTKRPVSIPLNDMALSLLPPREDENLDSLVFHLVKKSEHIKVCKAHQGQSRDRKGFHLPFKPAHNGNIGYQCRCGHFIRKRGTWS